MCSWCCRPGRRPPVRRLAGGTRASYARGIAVFRRAADRDGTPNTAASHGWGDRTDSQSSTGGGSVVRVFRRSLAAVSPSPARRRNCCTTSWLRGPVFTVRASWRNDGLLGRPSSKMDLGGSGTSIRCGLLRIRSVRVTVVCKLAMHVSRRGSMVRHPGLRQTAARTQRLVRRDDDHAAHSRRLAMTFGIDTTSVACALHVSAPLDGDGGPGCCHSGANRDSYLAVQRGEARRGDRLKLLAASAPELDRTANWDFGTRRETHADLPRTDTAPARFPRRTVRSALAGSMTARARSASGVRGALRRGRGTIAQRARGAGNTSSLLCLDGPTSGWEQAADSNGRFSFARCSRRWGCARLRFSRAGSLGSLTGHAAPGPRILSGRRGDDSPPTAGWWAMASPAENPVSSGLRRARGGPVARSVPKLMRTSVVISVAFSALPPWRRR